MKNLFTAIRNTALVGLVCVLALCALPAFAQNLPPTWVFARDYNGWSIVGQQANTYTFNGGACNYSPYNNGQTPPFFVFSGVQNTTTIYFPVAIIDADPTQSEIVSPTATSQTSASCGFAATTTHSHTSFVLKSGTAGLQEAVATQSQSAPPIDVILDKYWYQTVAALPGTPSVASIIAALQGNANVTVVDSTTSPWTFYNWSGGAYSLGEGRLGTKPGAYTPSTNTTAVTVSAAAPGNVRTILGTMTTSNASYANGGNGITAVRGATTIAAGTTVASGYIYGAQGKVIFAGTSNTQSGGGVIAGAVGQLDLTGSTITNTGDTAAGWFDIGGTGVAATVNNVSGLFISNSTSTKAGSVIHVGTTSGGFVDFFWIDDTSNTLATTTGSPGTCTNSGFLNVKVNSTALKIPFCQ